MGNQLFIFILFLTSIQTICAKYEWAVVGAGLAGITTVAVLLENKVDPASIIWIDPEFNMGRMGKYYRNVPANTKIQILKAYFNCCSTLKSFPSSSRDALFAYSPEAFTKLHIAIDPLLDATQYLRTKVDSLRDEVIQINAIDDHWCLECPTGNIYAQKVILAIGAHPKKLGFALPEIPLDEALDKNLLAGYVNPHDTIGVFGSMHSAMLMLKYLSEIGVKEIINFYTTHYQYRIPGAESLEGATKEWAKGVLEQKPPANLRRLEYTHENLERYLPQCTKVIYAIGFERNNLLINGSNNYSCDEKTGIICANLFGIGIAFPPTIKTLKCPKVAINGFASFSSYARRLIPQWMEL